MKSFIKVGGIQSVDEALGAVKAGADTIGFLVGLMHLAEDKISSVLGREISDALPDHIRTLLVTHLTSELEISALAKAAGVRAVQLHSDLPVENIQALRVMMPDLEIIKSIHVSGPEAIEKAKLYEDHVDMIVLDSRTHDKLGGTGQIHNWAVSRQIVLAVKVPVILAGGLNPGNITRAIEAVGPAGIDSNSGVEKEDGSKDFVKIKAFVRAGGLCVYPPEAHGSDKLLH